MTPPAPNAGQASPSGAALGPGATPAEGAPGGSLHVTEPLCAVFRRKLKAHGLKYTPERAQILDAIIRRDDVFQADQLLESMRRATRSGGGHGRGAGGAGGGGGGGGEGRGGAPVIRVSKATIYRTIKLLAEAGIIQQVFFDSDQAHYQLAYGRGSTGLLVNVDTRRITPIEVPEIAAIRDRVCREQGLEPEGHRLVIYARSRARPVGGGGGAPASRSG
jgi:Fur family ferric uptake transcriptional regulator